MTKHKHFDWSWHTVSAEGYQIVDHGLKTIKAAREALSYLVNGEAFLLELGAVRDQRRGWELLTLYGSMSVRLHASGAYCRFADLSRAVKGMGEYRINLYSGKYNLHFLNACDDLDEKLYYLQEHLARALPSDLFEDEDD